VLVALIAVFLAVRQSRIATSRQLAAQAQTAFTQERYHLATLLALEANKLDKCEGIDLLSQIPYDVRPTDAVVLEGHADSVTSVAWHPDGRRLAVGSGVKTIHVLPELYTLPPCE
jgi:hypothetical protein